MKVFFKILAIAFLSTGLSLYPVMLKSNSLPLINVKSIKQENKQLNNKIKIALPFKVTVLRNNGSPLSGKLTNFNATKQEITLSLSGQSKEYPVTEIKKIEFAKDSEYTSIHSGKIKFRGDSSSSNDNSQTWTESLNNFKIVEPEKGLAEITLNSVKKRKLDAINSVAKNSSYVVDEITFDPSAKTITIKAIPD